MPSLFAQRMARHSGSGRRSEPRDREELTALVVWMGILGVMIFILSPILAIVSIFLPVVGEMVWPPMILIGTAVFCAPFLWILLPICWNCFANVISNRDLVCEMLSDLWDSLWESLCGLPPFLWDLLCGLSSSLWDSLDECWSLLVEGIKIFVYRTPPFNYFWRHWTIQPHRFGWQPLNEPEPSNNHSQPGGNSKSDCYKTSKLCDQCLRIVHRSGLLAGSICILTPRIEWHDWLVSRRGLVLTSSQESCHLCNILWHSILETVQQETTNTTNSDSSRDQTIQMELKVKIWEDSTERWYDEHLRYMQVYRGEVSLCDRLAICEGSHHLSRFRKTCTNFSRVPRNTEHDLRRTGLNGRPGLHSARQRLDSGLPKKSYVCL